MFSPLHKSPNTRQKILYSLSLNECVGISEILHYSVSLLKLAVSVSSFVEVASMIWYSFFGILVLFIKQDIFCFVLFVPRIYQTMEPILHNGLL